MAERDLSDQEIVNIEAYLMGTKPPLDIAVNLAKLVREVRRRRFDEIGQEAWPEKFRQYGKHLVVCDLIMKPLGSYTYENDYTCTCGFLSLMEKAK